MYMNMCVCVYIVCECTWVCLCLYSVSVCCAGKWLSSDMTLDQIGVENMSKLQLRFVL